MKNIVFEILLLTFTIGCDNGNLTIILQDYFKLYNKDLHNYKIICIVPAEGCSSCIDPSIDYSKNAKKDFILVISSAYKKTLDELIKSKNLDSANLILDSDNLAVSRGLVSFSSPCFYFLKKGKVIKIIDLNLTYDKVSFLKEIDKFLIE